MRKIISRFPTGLWVGSVWFLFILRGMFYIATLPLWEGFDEWSHYALVQAIATRREILVDRQDRVSREVRASLQLTPWPPGGAETATLQLQYWRLSDEQRARRSCELRSMPAAWAQQRATDGPAIYEAQQAPLYYWLLALVYRLEAGHPFLTRVWILRLASLLLASAIIPIGFLLARRVFREELLPLCIIALLACTPQLMITVTHISNDSLALPIGTLLVLLTFRWKDSPRSAARSLAAGAIAGLALLTKASLLAFLPPILIFVCLWAARKTAGRQAALLISCMTIISAWWYVRNWNLTHSISGEQVEMAGNAAVLPLADAAISLNWRDFIDFAIISHTWLGNWSFLVVRSWIYRFSPP